MLLPALNQGPEVIKVFSILNSAEHEISNAHKYKMSRNSAFLSSDKPKILFFLLISVKMLAFQHLLAGKISFSTELGMKKVL